MRPGDETSEQRADEQAEWSTADRAASTAVAREAREEASATMNSRPEERPEERPVTTDDIAAPPAGSTAARVGEHEHGEHIEHAEHAEAGVPKRTDTRRADTAAEPVPLLPAGETDKFRLQWRELQTVFVDDPPESVHAADQLVAEVMQAVAASFSNHKRELERQWQRGEDVSTEDLRLALRQYRSFFDRLLST
jgi:hypothetical protein